MHCTIRRQEAHDLYSEQRKFSGPPSQRVVNGVAVGSQWCTNDQTPVDCSRGSNNQPPSVTPPSAGIVVSLRPCKARIAVLESLLRPRISCFCPPRR
mmetsp:Transcript_126821/g.206170  ORF Transcript_126821/g.206170 Transcript_126821/m.206170 type:complete len:97 (+) Transcript_126821:194-484(+)